MKRRTLLKALPLSAAWNFFEPSAISSVPPSIQSGVQAPAQDVIVEGAARFTVLTEHCIRMEYAPTYGFVDAPTLFAIRRDLRLPSVSVSRSNGALQIDTGKMKLTYQPDGKSFHAGNLSVLYNDGVSSFTWKPGDQNEHNLGGAVATLDGVGEAFPLPDGLLARDGWFLLEDSGQPVLIDGWIHQRTGGGPRIKGWPTGWNPDKDWYLFAYGQQYKTALRSLTEISGPVPMPRREVHGSWYCRWYPYTTEQFREIVQGYKDHDFPLDILVMDMEWHTKKEARYGYGHAGQLGWTGYTWNKTLIPDPEGFLAELRRQGIFTVLNDHPHDGVRDHEACYPAFKAMLGPQYPENPPFSAADPQYMKAYFEAAHIPIERQGVDFWWVDWQQDYLIPWVPRVPGLRHLPWLNHLYFQHSMQDGQRGQGFSRWGGWGDHRNPIQFSGDTDGSWPMLEFEIYFTLASGNAGCFFWAHDIGAFTSGFGTPQDSELFTRWVQFGALSSSLRLHSYTTVDRRPWLWGKQFENAMRDAYRLRSRLFPYIYSSVRQCYDQALPLLRPMYLDYPASEETYQHKTQYMLGDHLLVAPIVAPGKGPDYIAEQAVWFPEGAWYHFFTGERVEGGQIRMVTARLTEIPLYFRAGTPIAMQPYTPNMSTAIIQTLIVRCYPGASGKSVLYEDDGRSEGYLKDAFARTGLDYRYESGKVTLRIDACLGSYADQPQERSYRIELPATAKADSARVNGKKVSCQYLPAERMNVIEIDSIDIRKSIEIVCTVRSV